MRGFVFRGLLAILFLIAIRPLNAAGTFKNPLFIPTTSDPLGVVSIDLNRDGKPDLIYVDGVSIHTVHVLLGKGDGTFSHGQDLNLPPGTCGPFTCPITLADVTHDGNVDAILGGSVATAAQITVLPGNGDGTFGSPILSTFSLSGSLYVSLSQTTGVGDMNEDGALDLVVIDAMNGVLAVLLGDNTGKFSLSTSLTSYTRNAIYLADLNGDGHLDVVAMDNLGATFLVYFGKGDGTFQEPFLRYTTGAPTDNLVLTDLDGDGRPDVVAQIYPGQIVMFKGKPDGTFAATAAPLVLSSNALIFVDDYNDDGIKDFFFLTPVGVGVNVGLSNLTYAPVVSTLSGNSSVFQTTKGDFNGDGHTDIAMGVEGGIAILEGRGDGTFKSGDFYDMGQPVGTVAVADFTGDNLPDIAVSLAAEFPRLLLGNGKGQFVLGPDPNASYGAMSPYTSMSVGDFDADGRKDLAAQFPDAPAVLFGNGNGTFAAPLPVPGGSTLIADLNGDGLSDMTSVLNFSIAASLGQKNRSFTQVTTGLRNANFTGLLAVGDINHDGMLDVLVSDFTEMEAWLGNGDGTFTYRSSFGVPGQTFGTGEGVYVVDLDGDGNADVVVTPSTIESAAPAPLIIFYGNGDGTFQPPILMPTSHRYDQLTIADVNQDNRPDLVLNDGSGIAVILNQGPRNFGPEEHFIAGNSISTLSVTDVNGDGYPDIVAANPGGTTVAVLLNEPNGTPPGGATLNGNVSIGPEPSSFGQPFSITLSVSPQTGSLQSPTGSVGFSVDGTLLNTSPLILGGANYTVTSPLNPGTHTISAMFSGDGFYAPQSFSTSHVILPQEIATQTALVATPATVLRSQTVRFTATVTGSTSPPSGIVTFLDGAATLGSERLPASAVVVFDFAGLASGTHAITARYQGASSPSQIFDPSTSSVVSVVVNSNLTATSLTASGLSPTAGTVVTLSAKVTSLAGVPFGGVTFFDGPAILGTSSLTAEGIATFSTASLSQNAHSLSATFNANATFAASSSSDLNLSVVPAAMNAVQTLVAFSSEGNSSDGTFKLSARVNVFSNPPDGTVTFLEDGNILGSAAVDHSGTAILPVGVLASGDHHLTASFSGGLYFAPSASPVLHAMWPPTGPGFSLSISPTPVTETKANSELFRLSVTAPAAFAEPIRLSCADGLPAGYQCEVSPSTFEPGQTSYVKIWRPTNVSSGVHERSRWVWAVVATVIFLTSFYSFLDLLSHCHRGFIRLWILSWTLAGFAVLAACSGITSSNAHSKAFVMSVQAVSGTGTATIIHSVQVSVDTSKLK